MTTELLLSLGKLEFIGSVTRLMLAIGIILAVIGWLWLVYQEGRSNVVTAIIGLVFPPFALYTAAYELEHRHKVVFTALFLGGMVVAGLGYGMLYSVWVCEIDDRCGVTPLTIDEEEGDEAPADGEEQPAGGEAGEESSAFPQYADWLLS